MSLSGGKLFALLLPTFAIAALRWKMFATVIWTARSGVSGRKADELGALGHRDTHKLTKHMMSTEVRYVCIDRIGWTYYSF